MRKYAKSDTAGTNTHGFSDVEFSNMISCLVLLLVHQFRTYDTFTKVSIARVNLEGLQDLLRDDFSYLMLSNREVKAIHS